MGSLGRCDVAIIPNITLHETLDRLDTSNLPVNVSHAVEETLKQLSGAGTEQVAVLGSSYTMASPYWTKALAGKKIDHIALTQNIGDQVDEFRRKVYAGEETAGDVEIFRNTVVETSQFVPIVIACTELSIYAPRKLDAVFDCAIIQIEAAIERARL